ncbi:GNAT family N-acetyltransferase [Candidatus Epulonipiscioides gigas]|nr:GNAT family N-acetyltransferase [Epulopiscium sp. SCG-C07WGA-EpuloA2]
MIIRNERFEDYSRVEEVAREAFWNLYIPGATEHVVVNKMRNHPDFIKELAFVIEINGIVEGAIFYTHSKIVLADNSEYKTISFGPVFIATKWHRQGLGRALITHSIEVAKNMGFSVITTLGYPYHYNPYGFVGGKKYGISMADGNFYKGLLVLPLVDNILSNINGYALFSESLEVTENEVNEFEKVLPYKEKQFQPSQLEYQLACQELDQ